MAQYHSKKNKKVFIIIILLLLLLLIFWLIFRNKRPQPIEQTNGTILHGTMLFSSQVGEDLSIEFWFDDPKYRLTWSKLGKNPYLHMISPDGETLYHHLTEDNTTNVSYISPKMHQWMFTEPTEYLDKQVWTEDNLAVERFIIKKLWSIEGAQQDFYLEDITKYSSDEGLQKVVLRTKGSIPKSTEALIESTYSIESIEKLNTVPKNTFKLP